MSYTAFDTLLNVVSNDNLLSADLRYCLVDDNKYPFKLNGTLAKINNVNDFCKIDDLIDNAETLKDYHCLGISIQASNITAIDIDKCFENSFDLTSAKDNRVNYILDNFKEFAYIEFSFSGKGLRVLFRQTCIKDSQEKYYIKNDKHGIEFYQPSTSFRYVTLTGKTIINNPIVMSDSYKDIVIEFLETWMKKQTIKHKTINKAKDERSIDELMKLVKILYLKNITFQNAWFNIEHRLSQNGQSLESQNDYSLLSLLNENITTDKDKLRQLFELSPFFKSKDERHLKKWLKNDYRYYEYVYNHLK